MEYLVSKLFIHRNFPIQKNSNLTFQSLGQTILTHSCGGKISVGGGGGGNTDLFWGGGVVSKMRE